MSTVGRNDPCPCGSGKKYKKCCIGKKLAEKAGEAGRASIHELDGRLAERIIQWAARHYGAAYTPFEDFPYLLGRNPLEEQIFAPWAAYETFVGDERIVERYLSEHQGALPEREKALLAAQVKARLSIWEILDARPGEGLRVVDRLTGEEREVRDTSASKVLVPGHGVLARVVGIEGVSVFLGMHPRYLKAEHWREVLGEARKRLGVAEKGSEVVSGAWLGQPGAAELLIGLWQGAVEALGLGGETSAA